MDMNAHHAIEISGVRVLFGKVAALDIDALTLGPGSSTVLVGPNGAGKSTLLLVVAGILQPTEGSARIGEFKPGSRGARVHVSFAPDQPALFDDLTLADQLEYVARLHRVDVESTASQQMIESLDASELLTKFPRSMSKGQRQKASLIVTTARPFEVLLLDEPTTALDAASRTALVAAIGDLAGDGVTVVSSTHDAELIEAADEQVTLINGQLADT